MHQSSGIFPHALSLINRVFSKRLPAIDLCVTRSSKMAAEPVSFDDVSSSFLTDCSSCSSMPDLAQVIRDLEDVEGTAIMCLGATAEDNSNAVAWDAVGSKVHSASRQNR